MVKIHKLQKAILWRFLIITHLTKGNFYGIIIAVKVSGYAANVLSISHLLSRFSVGRKAYAFCLSEYFNQEKLMIIFNTDLDNTMIYSYKHDIGSNKRCAEIYQGREVSFVTERTDKLLKAVNDTVVLVPTTTRTMEQYVRIDLGYGTPHYALACNGGVLVVNGVEDEGWYKESFERVENCQCELAEAEEVLECDENRTFEIRNIRDLFIFTKSSEPQRSVEKLQNSLNTELMDVFYNGVKVYAVPKGLSKGIAVRRFKEKLGADTVIAAGDSEFDLSMLNAADIAIAPPDFPEMEKLTAKTFVMQHEGIFSEFVLEKVLEIASQ